MSEKSPQSTRDCGDFCFYASSLRHERYDLRYGRSRFVCTSADICSDLSGLEHQEASKSSHAADRFPIKSAAWFVPEKGKLADRKADGGDPDLHKAGHTGESPIDLPGPLPLAYLRMFP